MPSTVSGEGADKFSGTTIAGHVIQVANFTTGASTSGTATIPYDNTVPQITEGTQFMSLVFTPKKANSKLKIEVVLYGTNNTAGNSNVVALFDGSANAISCNAQGLTVANYIQCASNITFYQVSSVSPITFSVRAGCNASATFYINSIGAAFGGSLASSLTITEIAQ